LHRSFIKADDWGIRVVGLAVQFKDIRHTRLTDP
jgi:hypothetical protein